MRLSKKIALISGAAGDIGRATARRFAAEGATLILTDIDLKGGQQALDDKQGDIGQGYTIADAL